MPAVPPLRWGAARTKASTSAGGHGLEDPLEDQQINLFMAQRKGQMIGEALARPIAFVEERPKPLPLSGCREYAVLRRSSDGGLAPVF